MPRSATPDLKLFDADPPKKRARKKSTQQKPSSKLRRPSRLGASGRAFWDKYARALEERDYLDADLDVAAFVDLCKTFDRESELESHLEEADDAFTYTRVGAVQAHPAYGLLHQLLQRREKLYNFFGMIPTSPLRNAKLKESSEDQTKSTGHQTRPRPTQQTA